MGEPAVYETQGGAAWIELNRPEKRNAVTPEMIQDIRAGLDRAVRDDEVRAVVITGRGQSFCAGADLAGGRELADAKGDDLNPFAALLLELERLPKPVIAAVNGPAFGGGLGLIAAADIAIADIKSRFSFSEVKLGLIPAMISVVVLPKIGARQARRLFLTGRRFTASEAMDFGLVHRVVLDGELNRAVEEEVAEICAAGPNAVAEAKRLIREIPGYEPSDAFRQASDWFQRVVESDEGREGMAAFVEKRAPRWRE